ncbi:hypothetical protein YQE_03700, partial [Dendroctonus ponderosae]
MESVSKAKQRFKQYPLIFGKCGKEASVYATCVLKQDNLMKDNCELASKPLCVLEKWFKADMVTHIIVSSMIRLCLVVYGAFHDQHYDVPYTDVDYKVFTDAARHVVQGGSPYDRHTFRYSPLIAILLTPNVFFHPMFGKIIFCEVDLVVAYFIRRLVYLNVFEWMSKYESYASEKAPLDAIEEKKPIKTRKRKGMPSKYNVKVQTAIYWAHRAMLFWLYNPLTMAISTRGNSDSIACLLVVLTLYGIQSNWHPFLVGLLHGFSVHFRIYPVIYSLLFFMYYSGFAYEFELPSFPQYKAIKSEKKTKKNKLAKRVDSGEVCRRNPESLKIFATSFWWYLWPNTQQLMLVMGAACSLLSLTGVFYYMYGYKFLYESLIYHLYLTAFVTMPMWFTGNFWQPILINLPPIVLILNFSFRYGLNKFSLNFGVLAQTIVFVIFNKVITSQYFVWIMGVLPLCIWQIKLSKAEVVAMTVIWFAAQGAWLVPAYLLEFRGEDTFLYIWIQSVSLFCAHIGIFGRLVKNFILPMGVLKNYNGRSLASSIFQSD